MITPNFKHFPDNEPVQNQSEPQRIESQPDRILERFKAVVAYITKPCFGEKLEPEKKLEMKAKADAYMLALDNALAVASSNMEPDLGLNEEAITLACLEDPAVQEVTLDIERLVVEVHGRTNSSFNFKALGLENLGKKLSMAS